MNADPCDHNEDAAGWVLGALTEQEAERFVAHLHDCASCGAEVARLAEAAELLLEGVPLVAPRPELRDRLLAAAVQPATHPDSLGYESSPTKPGRTGTRRRRRTGLLLALAAGLVVAVGILLAVGSRPASSTRTVIGQVTLQGGAPRAHALVSISAHQATLIVGDLAAPPPGLVYQAWMVPQGAAAAIPTGALFSVPRSGDTRISLPFLNRVARVIVTAEPPRGSSTPTLPAVALVDLQRSPP